MTHFPVGDPVFEEEVALTGPSDDLDIGTKGVWPRMITFGGAVENRLRSYIDAELEAFFLERQDLLEDWREWQTLYWAEPEEKERTFPFRRAANIVVPLASIAVEAVHANMMNTLFTVKPFWSIRPKSKLWIESAKPTERWLQSEVESSESLDMFQFCNEALLELYKLGTAVAKSGYERLIKKSLRAVGDTEEEYFYEARNGATVDRVPLANFIMRFAELDPQTAPLVGEKHTVTWSQLKRFAQSGRMDPKAVENIRTHWRDHNFPADAGDGTEYHKHIEELANAEPQWYAEFDFYELWISFDVDGDGWDEEIVVDYHRDSGSFLSARYNWYDDLHRPYEIGNYLNVEGIWPGIGIVKQTEQFQDEVTTIHRQRLDNATLANMAQIVLRKGTDYEPGTPLFPGKMWFLDDVDDIKEFKLAEVYPSSYANEEAVISYYERATSINDVMLGVPQQGTPGTATSDLTRLAEGKKRTDLVLKNIKRWLSKIGVGVITNYQIFGDQQVHWLTEGEDGIFVEQVLQMPSVLVRRGAIVELTVTDSITNQEVEKTQWMQLFQIITNYYREVLALAEILGPDIFVQLGQRALLAGDEALRRLLETYRITDSDRFAISPKVPPNGNEPEQTALPGQPFRLGLPTGTPSRANGGRGNRVGEAPSTPGLGGTS